MKRFMTILATLAILLVPTAPALAAGTDLTGNICKQTGADSSAFCRDKTATNPIVGTGGLISKVVRILAIVGGAAAVIMIVISGLRYVLSEGDPAKATQARNGLIYALAGLIVIIAAQTIIQFVLGKIYN